jgi:acyl phosphate:glycerol-3-phosphate acyltransferase
MLELGVKSLLAYFLGTLVGSLILGRFRGVDIRKLGSGNAGGTNALRTQGKGFALLVLLIDIGKGVLAVSWLPRASLPGIGLDPAVSIGWLTVACGAAAIAGHVYPVWFDFRGGKGAATVLGVVGAMQPWGLIPLLAGWLIVVMLSGYVGLATMLAGICLSVAVAWVEPSNTPMLVFSAAAALFIIFTHRSNIARMRAGTEHRVRHVWLLRPRA